MFDLKQYLQTHANMIDQRLDELLPAQDVKPTAVHEAMRYSVFAGGKRLRPILVLSAHELARGDHRGIVDVACAFEMIHTYSLIHDDLPCMDDDDFRRGKPSLHRAFPEGIAVLAGDALHALAFEILAGQAPPALVVEVAQAIGSRGMIGGQTLDLESEGKQLEPAEVEYIHSHKTGFLIRTAIRAGAMCAQAPDEFLKALTEYGERIGLAFQIIDDILDVEGSYQELGKQVGMDENRQKATYPRVYGLEESRQIAADLIEQARSYLLTVGPDAEVFSQIADFIIKRLK